MVAALVVLTLVVLVLLDRHVYGKRLTQAAARGPVGPPLTSLLSASRSVPAGVSLQPTFTWGSFGLDGELYLGVHPMLLGLIGTPLEVEALTPGTHVTKGEALVRIGTGGRHLTVRSPISGRVDRVNRPATNAAEPRNTWLYRLMPDHVTGETKGWLSGEQAAGWTRRRYADLREFLMRAAGDPRLGAVMADGGDLPTGILAEMDEQVWAGLDERLAAGETTVPEIQP
jgi:glycine cleavage system H lipoate-binding protein